MEQAIKNCDFGVQINLKREETHLTPKNSLSKEFQTDCKNRKSKMSFATLKCKELRSSLFWRKHIFLPFFSVFIFIQVKCFSMFSNGSY